jgi:hypothetical protein
MPPVASSQNIATLDEARAYYAAHLAGVRNVTCYSKPVAIVFEREATHLFSDDPTSGMRNLAPAQQRAVFDAIPPDQRVERRLPGGRVDVRRFNLERARLMDRVLPAVSLFTVSTAGTSARGRENRMLHGRALPDGRYMRVVLQPPRDGYDAFTCVSAYPVSTDVWRAARAAKSAKFPP